MVFQEMKHEELQMIINYLDQSLHNHEVWFSSLIRTLICHLPADQHDISEAPHKECRFGQWYYSSKVAKLIEHPGFKSIGEEHIRMHQLAKKLLNLIENGSSISPPDYDNFSNSLERMRLETTTLKRELENLIYNRDPLTGAINRVNMLTILREQQESAKREHKRSFITMMDIDHFKQINDKHNHLVGDSILAAVVHLIADNLGAGDKIFRYGGEEFLICLNNTETDSAFKKIEEIRTKISETDIVQTPEPIKITVSFGLVPLDLYSPVEETIERSDKALIAAKAAGRNCTQFWGPKK